MMVSVSAALRPLRSPYRPSSTAPRGRATNPTANTRKVFIRAVVVSSSRKKFAAM